MSEKKAKCEECVRNEVCTLSKKGVNLCDFYRKQSEPSELPSNLTKAEMLEELKLQVINLEAQIEAEKEPAPVVGELCIFDHNHFGILIDITEDHGKYAFTRACGGWFEHCKPIRDGIMGASFWKPWRGGSCPIDGELITQYYTESDKGFGMANALDWDCVIAYRPMLYDCPQHIIEQGKAVAK